MQITIKQDEIEKGIVAYLSNMGINTQNSIITIQLQAGRKGNGHSAIVDIEANESEVTSIDESGLELYEESSEVEQEEVEPEKIFA